MPQGPAARLADPVMHPLPPVLTGGPPSLNVLIGNQPAWKGIPLALSAAVQGAQQTSEAAIKVAENAAVAAQAAAVAAAGTPGAPAAVAAATAARLAAETLKTSSAAAMSGALSAAAAGGASMHACTVPWPIPPHGPGVVIDGSPTVLINNMPACRLGDTIVEAIGPPNKIAVGCMTVMIGDSAKGGAPAAVAAAAAAIAAGGGVEWKKQPGATDEDLIRAMGMWEDAKSRRLPDGTKPDTVKAMEALETSGKKTVIKVGPDGNFESPANEADGMDPTKGTNSTISFNPNKTEAYSDGTPRDPESSLAHEAVHGYQDTQGTTPPTREQQEVSAATAENQHRKAKGLPQRQKYGNVWDIPQF